MKTVTALLSSIALAALVCAALDVPIGQAQNVTGTRINRFRHGGSMDNEAVPRRFIPGEDRIREAPTGFDNVTNGFSPQGPAFEKLNEATAVANRSFNDNRFIFEEVETIADGLGPTYNAQSC